MADPIEDRYFSGNINLGMKLDSGLCTSELCPFKDRHAQVDGSGVNGIEPSVELKLFGDTLGLGDRHNVKSKLLKDSWVSLRLLALERTLLFMGTFPNPR